MKFESLANELLLDVFEYLNIHNLFHVFYNLNLRLNKLLFLHCQLHGDLNFESISKTNFDLICQQYLASNLDRITSIHLSDHHETPEQINRFFSYHFQFQQFIHLKSISLSYISSELIITDIITSLHHLNYLTHLKIDHCRVDDDLINNGWIFDQIWSLTNLTHCYFGRKKYLWNPFFISPKIISCSIKYLYLEGFSYNSNELHSLFFHTINLENLTIDVEHNYDDQQISNNIVSLKKLKIFVQYSPYITNNLFQYLPNLIDLTIELANLVIDGYQWEEILNKNLPNLKKFVLKMEFYLRSNDEQINRLLDSFRSSFWIDQHQWFIQCHWYLSKKSNSKVYLYTLPYYSKEFSIHSDLQFQSTYLNNEIHWAYDHVENLSFNNSIYHSIRFNNLKYLRISIPFDESFWLIAPNLNRLRSLHVKLLDNSHNQLQLENLIEKTTGLDSLTVTGKVFSYKILWPLRNVSIRRLHLYDCGCFDQEDWENFICSSLGIRCEVLFITVNNRNNILYLVNEMKNLRVLNVRSQDDQWKNENEELLIEDEFIHWLEDYLPRTCIIKRGHAHSIAYVQVWIR